MQCDERPTVDQGQARSGQSGMMEMTTQTGNKEDLEVFETNMSSKPRGTLRMALILACYSLGHKRLPTSYYSNNSPSDVAALE